MPEYSGNMKELNFDVDEKAVECIITVTTVLIMFRCMQQLCNTLSISRRPSSFTSRGRHVKVAYCGSSPS